MKTHTQLTKAIAVVAILLGIALTALGQPIPGQYIAVFKADMPNPAQAARELEAQHGLSVSYVYQNSIHGFAFAGNEQAAQALARNPRIAYVEQDQIAQASAAVIPTGLGRVGINDTVLGGIQSDATISTAGRVNANIAIIDTGLQRNHPDLNVDPNGVRPYFANVKGKSVLTFDNAFDDDNGHGTHVGGTAAANGVIVGVAPGALLTAVKVLGANGSGSYSIVIAGVDWVAGQPARFDVANMSLGGGFSQAVNDSVKNATSKGIVFAVAAGNAGTDASQFSPASEPSAITVSAMADFDGQPGGLDTTSTYTSCKNADGTGGTIHHDEEVPCWSNYGAGVDICAPGVLIRSTWPTTLGDLSGYNTISGTSMATPHVTGAAALYIAQHRASRTQNASWVDTVTQALTSSGWRVGDYGYFDYYTREPFTVRPSGDKDSIREPLLNVASLIGATVRPSPDFAVTISTPANNTTVTPGATVAFTASASLGADDWTTSIIWTSNIDGVLGTGGSIATTLSDGTHTIVASVPDSVSTFGGAASITIISGAATPAPKALFITVSFNKNPAVYYDGETMISSFFVKDELGVPVQDAYVSAVMKTPNGGTLTAGGYTDATGRYDASSTLNGKRGGGYGIYTITGSSTKTGYLRSSDVTGTFELKR
jgi:subtilisin family serine protease